MKDTVKHINLHRTLDCSHTISTVYDVASQVTSVPYR